MDTPALLAKGLLFATLDSDELARLAAFVSTRRCEAHQIVFTEGSHGDELYMIASGSVRLRLRSPAGEAIALGTLGPGDMFGEIAVLDGGPRSATVETLEPCLFLTLSRNGMLTFIQGHSAVAVKLLAVLANRLRLTDELIQDTLAFNLPAKLAKRLLGLANVYGQHTAKGIQINVRFSDQDLSNIVGAPQDKIHAQLTRWKDQGIITIKRGHIVVTNPHELESLS